MSGQVLGYVRVSTDRQEYGPEAQTDALRREAAYRGWTLDLRQEDAASAKSMTGRPVLAQALADLKEGRADALAVAKLDRLSRSVVDTASILAAARVEGWRLIALDLGMDTGTVMGKAMAQLAAVFGEMERERIGERTREGLARAKANGVRLGPPLRPATAIDYRIQGRRADGLTLQQITDELNRDGYPTAKGGRWWPATVAAAAARADRDPLPEEWNLL